MKKIISLLAIFAVLFGTASCQKDTPKDDNTDVNGNGDNNGDNNNGDNNGDNNDSADMVYVESFGMLSDYNSALQRFEYTYDADNNITSIDRIGIEDYVDDSSLEGDYDYCETFEVSNPDAKTTVIEYSDTTNDPDNTMRIEVSFNDEGYAEKVVTKNYNSGSNEMYVVSTEEYTYTDGYLATAKTKRADDTYTCSFVYTWEDGNLVKTTEVQKDEVKEDNFRTEYTYSDKLNTATNINIATMLISKSSDDFPLPAAWFGNSTKNLVATYKYYEKYGDDDWSDLRDDNDNTIEYEFDADGRITTAYLNSKYYADAHPNAKGYGTIFVSYVE